MKNCATCKWSVNRVGLDVPCPPCHEKSGWKPIDAEPPVTVPDFIASAKPTSKYHRPCKGIEIDVYDVLQAFKVTSPAIAHAVKKCLAPGQRGAKSWVQDVEEAIKSLQRALEMGE